MILFVDDERDKAEVFVEEMKSLGLPIRYFSGVDAASAFLARTKKTLDAVVLDVMMPAGHLFADKDVDDGISTGLAFYRLIRESHPQVYIFILTNLTDPRVAEVIGKDGHAQLDIKSEVYYDDYAVLVRDRYQQVRSPEK